MRFLYQGEQRGGSGRPRKYDGKVNLSDFERFEPVNSDEAADFSLYTQRVWAVSLKREIQVLVLVFKQKAAKERKLVLFSTDLQLAPEEIGGIGGFCTALALRKTGIDAVVYEQAEQLGEVGAGLTIWTNAVKALRSIGLADEVINAGAKIRRGEVRTPKGNVLIRTPFQELEQLFGEPNVALHRAELHSVLLDALPLDSVRIGMKCVGFKQDKDKITVSFSDGSCEEADFLIGADGIHSTVREMLFPKISLR